MVVEAVTVVPAGGTPRFTLGLDRVAASVEPTGAQTHAVLAVEGALAFTAEVPNVLLPYRVAAPIEVAAGVLRLVPASELSAVTPAASALRVDVKLAQGVTARAVPVACSALTLDPASPPPSLPQPQSAAGKDAPGTAPLPQLLLARGKTLAISSQPGAAPALQLELRSPVNLQLTQLAAQGGWLLVTSALGHGGLLRGWVPTASVRPRQPSESEFAVGSGVYDKGLGTSGFGQGNNLRIGPARIRTGTPVYAKRGSAPWATVQTAEPLPLRHVQGDDWAAILAVPGLRHSGDLIVAWVPMSAVTWAPQ